MEVEWDSDSEDSAAPRGLLKQVVENMNRGLAHPQMIMERVTALGEAKLRT